MLSLATVVATLLRLRAGACVVLACVAAMLCAANIASAQPSVQPKTRVCDFLSAAPLHIRLDAAASPRLHPKNQLARSEPASDVPHAARGAPTAFKTFSRGNFRHNLGELTGGIPKGAQAHHVLPQKFADQFGRAGINIHDPKFGAWWEAGAHQRAASAYNQAWERFLQASPSREQILQFGRDISGQYGLSIGF